MEEKGKNINLKLAKRFKDIYFYKDNKVKCLNNKMVIE